MAWGKGDGGGAPKVIGFQFPVPIQQLTIVDSDDLGFRPPRRIGAGHARTFFDQAESRPIRPRWGPFEADLSVEEQGGYLP